MPERSPQPPPVPWRMPRPAGRHRPPLLPAVVAAAGLVTVLGGGPATATSVTHPTARAAAAHSALARRLVAEALAHGRDPNVGTTVPSAPAPPPTATPTPVGIPAAKADRTITTTDPVLDQIEVTGAAFDAAVTRLVAAHAALDDATGRRDRAAAEIARLQPAIANDRAELDAVVDRRADLDSEIERLEGDLRDLAVDRFVAGPTGIGVFARSSDPGVETDRRQTEFLGVYASRDTSTRLAAARADLATSDNRRAELTEQAAADQADLDRNQAELADATTDTDAAHRRVAAAEQHLRDVRPNALVSGSDMPLRALDAYWRVARKLARDLPSCHLRWPLLAGIGRSESAHGTFGGATLGPTGAESFPVIGIPLDGTNSTQAIADTDQGALDGDATVDRAVGPMQFIPSSWRSYGRDLSGDGRADPQNIYDAALAAGRLLCRAGGDLADPQKERNAVLAYNQSDAYADLVLSRAGSYATLAVPDPTAPSSAQEPLTPKRAATRRAAPTSTVAPAPAPPASAAPSPAAQVATNGQ